MKYNMDAEIIGHLGKAIVKSEEDHSPVKFGDALQMACINANQQTHKSGEAKLNIYRILQKVTVEGEVELEASEVALLKTLVGDIYSVAMVGPIFDLLEKNLTN